MSSKEVVEIKKLCLDRAIEAYTSTIHTSSHGAVIYTVETARVIIDVAKRFENYFGIATAEGK